MTDRPIIFSGPMVKALIDGRKTQTRRLASSPLAKCQSGDRLWVRESAVIAPPGWTDSPENPMGPHRQEVGYIADHGREISEAARDYGLKKTPSIYMPRWASRLTLIVTDVRAQQIQDISEEDAIAEGIMSGTISTGHTVWAHPGAFIPGGIDVLLAATTPTKAFEKLWNILHTKGGERWGDNPDITALTFTVHASNIDTLHK